VRTVTEAAWLCLADQITAQTLTDRGAVQIAMSLGIATDQDGTEVEVPTIEGELARLREALQAPPVMPEDEGDLDRLRRFLGVPGRAGGLARGNSGGRHASGAARSRRRSG
jgi:hypothetical protein